MKQNRFLFLCVFLILCGIGCGEKQVVKTTISSVFSMDSVSEKGNFLSTLYISQIQGKKTSEVTFSGSYSCQLDKKEGIGFLFGIDNVSEGDIIKVSVWIKENNVFNQLALTSNGNFYKSTASRQEEKAGWYKKELEMIIPEKYDKMSLLIRTNEKEETYIDELKVLIIKRIEPKTLGYNLLLTEKAWDKLSEKREEALSKKILITEKNDWVKGRMVIKQDTFKIKLRLKGDWTDHLQGKKWSYRIKVLDENYKGNPVFSLQAPETRGFLYEWVYHKLLQKEGILTPDYRFIYLSINDEQFGVYAKEDHFTQEMLLQENKEPGPILKFNEDLLWDVRANYPSEVRNSVHTYEAAEIEAFENGRIEKDSMLYAHFIQARKMLYEYQFNKKDVSELFDINKLAKYMAIMDNTKSYHGLIWHNKRMYYNPKTSKIESIGYDGFSGNEMYTRGGGTFLGDLKVNHYDRGMAVQELNSVEFRTAYLKELTTHFNEAYFEAFNEEIKEELNNNSAIIKTEYPDYEFDLTYLLTNNRLIMESLKHTNYDSLYKKEIWKPLYLNNTVIDKKGENYIVDGVSLKCYQEKNDSLNNYSYTLVNFFPEELYVIRLCDDKGDDCFDFSIKTAAYQDRFDPPTLQFSDNRDVKTFYYKRTKDDKEHQLKVINLPPPF